jgi:hypothetical protein
MANPICQDLDPLWNFGVYVDNLMQVVDPLHLLIPAGPPVVVSEVVCV